MIQALLRRPTLIGPLNYVGPRGVMTKRLMGVVGRSPPGGPALDDAPAAPSK